MNRAHQATGPSLNAALEFQARILEGVSRTFALTIPSLPEPLRLPITNAYLLCRMADTIEDDSELPVDEKRASGRQFIDVLCGRQPAQGFARDLAPRLASETLASERELIAHAPEIVEVTRSLGPAQRNAMIRCVSLMSDGMHRFQQQAGLRGLDTQLRMDEYCYFVAGVVGEMLTELFCEYSEAIARRRARLMRLAPSFGQGLQMTNILKDIRADRARGVCWLPRTAFGLPASGGNDLVAELDDEGLRAGIEKLAVIAHGHLRNALSYTLLIPRRHLGIRRFCLWALGMAVPTLTNVYRNPLFTSGEEVKITRRDVRRIVRQYGLMAGSNGMLQMLFKRASSDLPESDPGVASGLDEIARTALERHAEHTIQDSVGAK